MDESVDRVDGRMGDSADKWMGGWSGWVDGVDGWSGWKDGRMEGWKDDLLDRSTDYREEGRIAR